MKNISIQIPSLIENIQTVENLIDNIKEKFSLSNNIYGNIMVSVTESVNNAILHGNKQDKSKNVSITLNFHKNHVTFSITDQGKGFDFNNLPDPTTPNNLKKTSGRGVFLMKNLADEIYFTNKGRKVKLVFYIR